jgi:RNA polymerase sigma factor (sigma-70 family)
MSISPPKPARAVDAVTAGSSDPGPPSSSSALSDGRLLQAYLRTKEEAAFGQLVSRFGTLVFAVALRSLRDRHAAEDVFQATFLVLARDARKIRSPESIAAWLHGTALRISRRALARRRDEVSLEQTMHPPSTISADNDPLLDEISERFEQQLVDEELQRLPPVYRAPLVLHFLEGKTCEETAAALGISEGAVRGRLQRGKRQLKFRLMKRGVEVSAVMGAIFLWQALAEAAVQPPLIDAATRAGMAIAQGAPFAPGCSPEAVHLAAQETAMLTTTKVLASTAVLFGGLTVGWFAHDAVGSSTSPVPDPVVSTNVPSLPSTVPSATITALAFADPAPADDGRPQLILKYDDGKPDGKKSIAGTGEMIRFTLPDKSQELKNLRIHCARYGTPKPPDEDAEITIVSGDGSDIIHTEFVPYSTFQRGESRWTTIRLEDEITVPETFWVIFNFNAEATKGVYVSYDTSTEGQHSKIGLPGSEPKDAGTGGDWMVQAILTKPE